VTTQRDPATRLREQRQGGGHGGHGWMMIACCIPMLVIAGILVATGVASPGFLFVAVGCTLMMALMMRGMGHGGRDDPVLRHPHVPHGWARCRHRRRLRGLEAPRTCADAARRRPGHSPHNNG